jgi:hypothetical protein
VFFTHMQRGTAGRQHLERGTACKQGGDQLANRVYEVLAVVEEQQHLGWPEMRDEGRGEISVTTSRHIQGGGNGCRQDLRVTDRREVNEGHAVSEGLAGFRRNRKSELRLANTSRSRQREESHGVIEQQRASSRTLTLSSNQASARERKGCE